MADNKKLSELTRTTSLSSSDEFVVVDKSTTSGSDASSTGRTSKIRFDDLKTQIGSQGQKGQKGQAGQDGASVKGQKGQAGQDGASVKGQKGQAGDPGFKGQKGQAGQDGASVKGQKGQAGQDGASVKGQKGQAGQDGNSVKGQKGEIGVGQKGQKGQTGDSVKGQKGQTGMYGITNPHIMWRGDSSFAGEAGNRSFKKLGSSNWSTGYGYTAVYHRSGCSLTFTPADTLSNFMIGLSSTVKRNDSSRYYNIDYGFYLKADGMYDIRKAGPRVKDGGTYTKDTVFTVTYDNHSVRYFVNGVLKHTEPTTKDRTFFVYMSIYTINNWTLKGWSFDAVGSRGIDGSKGQKGDFQKGQKGQKGDFQKGQKGQPGTPSTQKGPKGPQGNSGSPWGGGTFTGEVIFDKSIQVRGNVMSGKQPRLLYRGSVSISGGTTQQYRVYSNNGGTKTSSYGDTANQLEKIFGKYTYQKGDKAVLVTAPTFEIGARVSSGKSSYMKYSMTNLKPTMNDSNGKITCTYPHSVGTTYTASYTYEIYRPSNL